MQSFTVHYGTETEREQAVFVADRWSWTALVFGPLWLLYHRQWLAFVLFVLLLAAISVLGLQLGLHPAAISALGSLANLWLALEGNALVSAGLTRSGKPVRAVITAATLDEAEARFFAGLPEAKPATGGAGLPSAPAASILGVFPQPGGRL